MMDTTDSLQDKTHNINKLKPKNLKILNKNQIQSQSQQVKMRMNQKEETDLKVNMVKKDTTIEENVDVKKKKINIKLKFLF